MKTVGIDIGSLSTKIVLLDDNNRIINYKISRSTHNFQKIGHDLFKQILNEANLQKKDIYLMSTGYGRHTIDIADDRVTEITAHAKGILYFFPNAISVIDIGGQDSKAILISSKTKTPMDFQMNDKCAAGTGRFLEVMANALEVPLEKLGMLALQSKKPESISSTCTVFAESEVISLFAQGAKKEDIAAGIHKSIARRVASMAKRIGVKPQLVFCGGVARNPAMKIYLEDELGFKIEIPQFDNNRDAPQLTGALGAALIAQEKV
jgi:predicted CoA-substrate-specific enzyme activase